jgi:hypothetical protein
MSQEETSVEEPEQKELPITTKDAVPKLKKHEKAYAKRTALLASSVSLPLPGFHLPPLNNGGARNSSFSISLFEISSKKAQKSRQTRE